MKKALLIVIALVPFLVFAQDGADPGKTPTKAQPTIVSISAKATDVRSVISDLFTQAKKNFVLQPGVQFALYLSLNNVEFEEALNIICKQANLQFDIQNGIYYVSKAKPPVVAPVTPPQPKGTLDKAVLDKTLTTKMYKTDIRIVFAAFAKQTDVTLDVDKSVPNFKLDAILLKTSLKYALDKVTEATGLKYKFTDKLSILIYKPDENKVAVSSGD